MLEHFREPVRVMEELHRICKDGARITIAAPYFRSVYAFIDPTHRCFFSANWFSYFDPDHLFCQKYCYSAARFKVDKVEFDREWKSGGMGFLHRLMVRVAERRPNGYEHYLSHLYPLNFPHLSS